MIDHPPLTDDQLDGMRHRAQRFAGAWTGTSGSLAADVMRLLAERQRLIVTLAMLRERHSLERYEQQRGRD